MRQLLYSECKEYIKCGYAGDTTVLTNHIKQLLETAIVGIHIADSFFPVTMNEPEEIHRVLAKLGNVSFVPEEST